MFLMPSVLTHCGEGKGGAFPKRGRVAYIVAYENPRAEHPQIIHPLAQAQLCHVQLLHSLARTWSRKLRGLKWVAACGANDRTLPNSGVTIK